MTFARASDGAWLWCESTGARGAGLPVVLLPGQAMDSRCWAPAVALLAPHRRVLLPDYRGLGRSGRRVPPGLSTRDLAADVE